VSVEASVKPVPLTILTGFPGVGKTTLLNRILHADHAVGPRVSVTLGEPWGNEAPRTRLVFLSTPGDLDEAALQAAFDGCRTELSLEQAVAAQQTWMRGERA
jgi:G3E family GTPase